MKVLLTRPQGRNQAMQTALEQHGVPYMVTPLLSVVATQQALSKSALADADVIIFISTNAVKFAQQQLNQPWPQQARYYAVGQATFDAMQAIGLQGEQAPLDCQQTEGLLTLASLHQLNNQNIVIIRGVGGREDLATQLKQRGATVQYWQVYQRVCPPLSDATLPFQWQDFGIDTIVITSGAVLDNLLSLTPKELFPWLHSCLIIVPSNRVAAKATQMGFAQVIDAKAANCQAVMAALFN
ncbi:uroporphyrinogen-III synthase [Shewanella marina]|uniref:uroporphyrinogen-III synthase n=1 Tax=Shewanella marina TaxID=487319 RepID=UPI000472BCAD|nr:uroporphyrinogen-III synthase [Shewanella marina]